WKAGWSLGLNPRRRGLRGSRLYFGAHAWRSLEQSRVQRRLPRPCWGGPLNSNSGESQGIAEAARLRLGSFACDIATTAPLDVGNKSWCFNKSTLFHSERMETSCAFRPLLCRCWPNSMRRAVRRWAPSLRLRTPRALRLETDSEGSHFRASTFNWRSAAPL